MLFVQVPECFILEILPQNDRQPGDLDAVLAVLEPSVSKYPLQWDNVDGTDIQRVD